MAVTPPARRRRGRRVVAISSALLAVGALVLTGFALRYPGLSSTEVEVSDGGVWVTNASDGLMGRLNVDAAELDGRLAMTGEELDIVQDGYTVIETGPRGMTPINTASVTRGGLVELPVDTQVLLGGDRVAIAAPDGRVWILTPEEAAAFSVSAVEPTYEAKQESPAVAVTDGGTIFVLDGDQLLEFPRAEDTRDTEPEKAVVVSNVATRPEMVQLTTVGEEPVVLDRENRMLRLGREAKDYRLEDYGITTLDLAQLQQPGAASDDVVLATERSLLVIPLDSGEAQVHDSGGTGTEVVRPAQVKGCAYGAWNGSLKYVRACEGQEPVAEAVPKADSAMDLTLRVNRDQVVLNDQEFGLSWEIMDSMQLLVEDWTISQEIQQDDSKEEEKESLTTTITNVAAEREEENRPPTAEDDAYGVRPGASVVLPVTRNDLDPDGDILTASVDGEQPGIGSVTPIRGGTQFQIEVAEDASGSASFTYTADDGRGGRDSATVSLDVKDASDNEGPRPVEDAVTKVQVRSGEEISFNITPYYEDPEGDAFYLANAQVAPEDVVTFSPDGLVTFNDAGLSPGTKEVELTFRDEFGAEGTGTVEIESVTDNDLPPITTADHATVVAGQDTTVKPLVNDLNPNGGDLELLSVGESEGLEVDPALEAGTIDVSGTAAGVHYLSYNVAARGSSTASRGLIRVDVVEPAEDDLAPVAVDDLGTVTTGSDTLIDPLENDVDPTGGVLVVNALDVPEDSGLKATIVEHHLLRVEAEPGAPATAEPVPVTYEVSNSRGTATGTVRVMVASTDTQFANPEAVPDRAVVRAGDMVSLDVTANDVSPTDSELHLAGLTDTSRADELGHAERHQDVLRFRADDDATGEAVVTYEVVDETGRSGSAQAHITIVPHDADNDAPKPENLTARAVAGTTVRIPVPTTGIDPDGDSVMLSGIASPTPQLGEVVTANGQWIEYRPYEDSQGTDRFRYQVMDRHGAIGTAEVQVGIAAPTGQNHAPYAVDDTVEVRPDREVQIPVLENDTDPEGDALHVVRDDVEALSEIEVAPAQEGAEDDGMVTVTTPDQEGTHSVMYAASDEQLKSTATATVVVSEDAPLRAPVAMDDFVAVEDVLDPETTAVEIDVLANDHDPDGSTQDLQVRLEEAVEGVELSEDGIARIVPGEEQQLLRYVIEDLDGLESAGYIWVPGTAKQAPVWVGEPLSVQAGSEVSVDLADPDNVRVRPGAEAAQITDPSLVSANHSDGGELVQDETTLVYRPAEDFSGNDTLTVEVTDGEVGDPTAATATLAIPVEVAAKDSNLPPTLQGAQLEVEQGDAQAGVDLAPGADDPDGDELTYALGDVPETDEVSIGLDDSRLTASAGTKAPKNTVVEVPVTVSDGTNDPVSATVQVTVVGSQRPMISTLLDEATVDAGSSQTIDVLDNDSNPFPEGERTLTSATTVSGDGEVTIDGDGVTVTPDADFHGILTAQYTVMDDTEDPDREVSGEIRVTVLGVPEAPSAPRIGEVGDGFVELRFEAGDDNGAPITGYTVSSTSGPAVEQECSSTSCRITGLSNDTEYTFAVTSTNRVGTSDPSVASATARPDVRPEKPAAPSAERGDTQLSVAWTAPQNKGSAIQSYTLQMQNTATDEISTVEIEGGSTSHVWTGLTNGVDYRFRVQARNLAENPSDWSGWSQPEHPAGAPTAPKGTPSAQRVNDPRGGGIEVTWPAMTKAEANGEPITHYVVTASTGTSQTVPASATSATFLDLDQDTAHSFTYSGVNSVGDGAGRSAPSNEVTPWAKPSAPTGVTAAMPDEGTGKGPNGRATVTWDAADGNGTSITKYVIYGGPSPVTVDASARSHSFTQLTNGTSYRFTVEARNGFDDDGGVSPRSAASNSIRPYTVPSAPTKVAISRSACTGENSCPLTFTASADGGDGGAGGKTLQVNVDGAGWKSVASPYSSTIQAKSGSRHTLDARVVTKPTNADGSTATMTSQVKKSSITAREYVPPPEPRIVDARGYGDATGESGCTQGWCYYIDFTVTQLAPNTTYEYCIKGDGPPGGDCWYPTTDGSTPTTGTFTTDANGEWDLADSGRTPYWGRPFEDVWIWVEHDGKSGESNRVKIPSS
ncbi:Ig-like domain-containing protein [Brachybacterium sp. YJGR34]|uniref:Ig-like domain-containing protein n=1 Tax=Brachybacterium sp. YJGR34 TaxID=2059911 RepID=UPI000E0B0525|nr:Ig-like domain-containing protein [Brachybacterium sp. YJGR34]